MSSGKKNTKILLSVMAFLLIALLAARVIFDKQFDAWGDGLEKIGIWQEQYKKDNPNAIQAEMDAAFDGGMQGLEKWKTEYLRDHPGATEDQINAAFDAAWAPK